MRCAHKKDCECIYFLLPCPSVSACKQASKQNKLRRPLPSTSSLTCGSWEAGWRIEMMGDVAARVVVCFSRAADRRDSSRFGLGLRLSFTWCANLTLGYGSHILSFRYVCSAYISITSHKIDSGDKLPKQIELYLYIRLCIIFIAKECYPFVFAFPTDTNFLC